VAAQAATGDILKKERYLVMGQIQQAFLQNQVLTDLMMVILVKVKVSLHLGG
jgi:hypothetical protein